MHRLLVKLGFEWFDYGADRIYKKDSYTVTMTFKSQTPNSKEEPSHIMVR